MLFSIDDDQWAQISEWRASLPKTPNLTLPARFSYRFTPNEAGCIITVEDGLTGASLILEEN